MDVIEMENEITEYLKEATSLHSGREKCIENLEDALAEFASSHRAVIYSDLELFGYSDVSAHQYEAIEIVNDQDMSVWIIVSQSIYLFIIESGLRLINELGLNHT